MLFYGSFELAAFFFGLLLGSFLNVCISRLPHGKSILKPRSHCPNCLETIRWYDNIPLLSWLLLATRCRHCKNTIPWRYPLIELATGVWFAIAAAQAVAHPLQVDGILSSIGIAILGFLLIGLIVMDWHTHTLPNSFTLTGIVIAFLLTCSRGIFLGPTEGEVLLHHASPLSSPGAVHDQGNVFLTGPEALLSRWLLATLSAALILLAVRWIYQALRHREGLGLGDVKLLAMIAAFLGFWPAVVALFAGVLLATAYSLMLLGRHQATSATRLPLGSFLAFGGLFATLFSSGILSWYKTLL
jgi:leader peptidase (prepilin peptidase) / N-methyltransferase